MEWAYGITTTPARRHTLLETTVSSLKSGGFDKPTIFVDACSNWEAVEYERQYAQYGLEIRPRGRRINVYGNMMLALAELYIRQPHAARYALFQDDVVTYQNLRQYLERMPYPHKGYLNLYNFPFNEKLCPRDRTTGRHLIGWHNVSRRGLGAVALVFSKDALTTLLFNINTINKPGAPQDSWRKVDGMIITSMTQAGWCEYVHYPSLVQHIGIKSTMDKRKGATSPMENPPQHVWSSISASSSFRGVQFDALELIGKVS